MAYIHVNKFKKKKSIHIEIQNLIILSWVAELKPVNIFILYCNIIMLVPVNFFASFFFTWLFLHRDFGAMPLALLSILPIKSRLAAYFLKQLNNL
mgnify:CR=1 FL=1